MKKLILILLLLPCLLSAAQLYKVELIVFSHVTAAGLNSETWPIPAMLPDLKNVENLMPAETPPGVYQVLPSSEFTLNRDAAELAKTKDYPVLVHLAWLQSGQATRESPRVHIVGGPGYDANGQVVAEGQPAQFWAVDGFVRVSRPYTFQVDANLVLTVPKNIVHGLTAKLTQDVPVYQFTLIQSDHPKLKEVYYFDHPLFGMLLQITPVKNP
jgi:hypothetical protein